jgi:hypothetical protein
VSTGEQVDSGAGLTDQEHKITAQAQREGWALERARDDASDLVDRIVARGRLAHL